MLCKRIARQYSPGSDGSDTLSKPRRAVQGSLITRADGRLHRAGDEEANRTRGCPRQVHRGASQFAPQAVVRETVHGYCCPSGYQYILSVGLVKVNSGLFFTFSSPPPSPVVGTYCNQNANGYLNPPPRSSSRYLPSNCAPSWTSSSLRRARMHRQGHRSFGPSS